MSKVSIIVPVYNVEKFIERCARSLFEQTLDDLEYLFIDDCSMDDSMGMLSRVLEEYPQRKNQVRIHRMERHSGQAALRKWGMEHATGEYVIHCDSDDWVATDMYERMYDVAKKGDFDVVMCDFYDTDGVTHRLKSEYVASSLPEVVGDVITKKTHSNLWNKMCRGSLLQGVSLYPKHDMGEDQVLLLQLMYGAKKWCSISEPFYYRYLNPESITKKNTREAALKRFHDSVANAHLIEEFLQSQSLCGYDKELDQMKFYKRSHLLPLIGEVREYRKLWINTFPEINGRILLNGKVRFNDRVKYVLALVGLYGFVMKIIKRG